jgi:hypothetical protein
MKLFGDNSKLFLPIIICIIIVTINCGGGNMEFHDIALFDSTIPPTAPTNVIATATSPLGITLSWNESTDNKKVQGYRIWRDDAGYMGQVTGTSYHQSWLSPETEYCYYVQAYDLSGNESSLSDRACVITNIEVGLYSSIAIDSNDIVHIME